MPTTPGKLGEALDPLLGNVALPISAIYHPLGFPLRLMTNSQDVADSAEESWGRWCAEYDVPPVTIRAIVQPVGVLAPPPVFRRQGHLMCIVSDANNFAIADLHTLESCLFVSVRTARDHAWLRWYFVESLGYLLLAQRHTVPLHAACVEKQGVGVLLCGASGAGKSTLSFACARAGWNFVSDDATALLPDRHEAVAVGRPHRARFRPDAPRWFPELERFATRVRPNGKLSVEVPLTELPGIRSSGKCRIGALVSLDRGKGIRPSLDPCPAAEITERLLDDSCSYGEESDRLYRRTVRKLTDLPAYRLRYERLDDGVALLASLSI